MQNDLLSAVEQKDGGFKENTKHRIKCGWISEEKHSLFCMTK